MPDLSLAASERYRCERSNLYGEAIRIISDLKERGLILSLAENAAGLMSSGHKEDFARLVKDLSEVGHQIGWITLDSQHVPVFHRIEATNEELGKPSPKGGCECLYLGLSSILERSH